MDAFPEIENEGNSCQADAGHWHAITRDLAALAKPASAILVCTPLQDILRDVPRCRRVEPFGVAYKNNGYVMPRATRGIKQPDVELGAPAAMAQGRVAGGDFRPSRFLGPSSW
jgi:hypothetical protein